MKFSHHQLTFELEDSWLGIAGMELFKPNNTCYSFSNQIDDRDVFIIDITDIAPCILRSKIKGVFCDKSPQITAQDRVVSILEGFRDKSLIQPIEVKYYGGNEGYIYEMYHGSHRLHCSIAAGFTHIPAVFSHASLRKSKR